MNEFTNILQSEKNTEKELKFDNLTYTFSNTILEQQSHIFKKVFYDYYEEELLQIKNILLEIYGKDNNDTSFINSFNKLKNIAYKVKHQLNQAFDEFEKITNIEIEREMKIKFCSSESIYAKKIELLTKTDSNRVKKNYNSDKADQRLLNSLDKI